ncbi:hypothetical protein AB0G55_21890 [Streptomyces toyocaensis]|uniref:hypothetical protein n=1 Tax=Streptomyces toyocaensis TaxID=55952 RepID=UPI003404453D
MITLTRRRHAPHLGAGLALTLRPSRTQPVYRRPEAVATAESLLAVLDADEQGPWVLSPEQLDVLTRAMDVRSARLPSTARQHPDFDAAIRAAHTHSLPPHPG